MKIEPEYDKLLEEAQRYERGGDTYTAIKLYRRLIKMRPEGVVPYRRLGQIYKHRREWKPTFHYCKRSVALDATDRTSWWNLGIAATGLKKYRMARSVWAKFGHNDRAGARHPLGLQIRHQGQYEILWMKPLDPCRGEIISIPHPGSGLHYKQVMLYDREPVGHHVINRRRIAIQAELGSHRLSPFQTFSCLLHTGSEAAIQQLDKMCQKAGVGFEVWSNALRAFTPEHRRAFPEYYADLLPKENRDQCLVALAATHEAEVLHLLDAWQLVSLASYSDLRAY